MLELVTIEKNRIIPYSQFLGKLHRIMPTIAPSIGDKKIVAKQEINQPLQHSWLFWRIIGHFDCFHLQQLGRLFFVSRERTQFDRHF